MNALEGSGPERLPKLTTAEVRTKEDFLKTMAVLKEIFTDPRDLESDMTLARYFHSPKLARYYLFMDEKKEAIGMQLLRTNPHVPDAMYIPYAGFLSKYTGLNAYPKLTEISDAHMRSEGVKFSLADVEDPKRIGDAGIYPDESPADVVRRAERRISALQRALSIQYVNDPDIPYIRPASDDPRKLQAYDLLGFRAIDKSDSMWQRIYNEDRTAIRRETYGEMYLKLMQIEYGDEKKVPSKEELRDAYPAADTFFNVLENSTKEWVPLYKVRSQQKAIDAKADVSMRESESLDERTSKAEIDRQRQ